VKVECYDGLDCSLDRRDEVAYTSMRESFDKLPLENIEEIEE
jgi:hypothetical protein